MKNKALSIAVLLLALLFAALPGMAADKGRLGFSSEVAVDGWLSPVLKRVKVTAVVADSPAAKAGLLVRDELVEINGKPVDGAPARATAAEIKGVKPGEHLRLKVKRPDGSVVAIDIVAGQ